MSRAAVRSRGVHGEGGQATVEWVALVLLAALVVGAAAAFAGREPDRGLGELVAKRIARGAGELEPAAAAAAPAAAALPPRPLRPRPPAAARSAAPVASAPARPVSAPLAPAPRRVSASPAIRGIGSVARHAWIVCLGYHRWRYEREHPIATIEGLPLDVALQVVNDCINPHDYLFED